MQDMKSLISRKARARSEKVYKHWSRRLGLIQNGRGEKRRALAGK